MNLPLQRILMTAATFCLAASAPASAQITPGEGWPQMNRTLDIGNFWDTFTNRHYGGYSQALVWPGGWWDRQADDENTQRRTFAFYKGFLIGARNVMDPQYPDVIWPYMVGQRDGWNDGELGIDILPSAPDPHAINTDVQTLFKGRLARRTFRQAYPVVAVDGEVYRHSPRHIVADDAIITGPWPQLVGDESDAPYQVDVIDPDLPADLTLDTYSWSRMGIATNRRVYAFVDRRNDDYMFWHWRMINDGIWGKMGVNGVDCCGGAHDTVGGVMMSLMFWWDGHSAGAVRTNSARGTNDSIWRYYGVDYDGARTEDMRLVYVIDGDQDQSVYDAPRGKQNDIGDPDPTTGHLLSAKTGGWQVLHYDTSPSDRRDDPAQPRTMGWQNHSRVMRTGAVGSTTGTYHTATDAGHEAKYRQMLLGYQGVGGYYLGPFQETPGRDRHPNADTHGASWIKASNDPATSSTNWPGRVLGVDMEVSEPEQQAGFGPDDLAPFDTLNGIHALGVKGLEEPYAAEIGRRWLAGEIDDADKDALVHSTIDSLFRAMRQAKAVYESALFDDDHGGKRYASARAEFEEALRAAVGAGILSLSPPAPATFTARGRSMCYLWPGKDCSQYLENTLSWTLNTATGSDIAGWRLYRAEGRHAGDSTFALIAELPPSVMSWSDTPLACGSYFYYLTTFDADGNESTMHTRTFDPVVAYCITGIDANEGQPLRFHLAQNAPNPFNPTTSIPYAVPSGGRATLSIYDVNGRLVRTLVDEHVSTGAHTALWDGTDDIGRDVGSGVYVYRLQGGDDVIARRLTLIR